MRMILRSLLFLLLPLAAQAQDRTIELTLDRMVELGLRDSYRIRQLQLDIERTRSLLRAEQAGLKSRVDMNIAAPEIEAISDYKWNSTLQKNELVHEKTRRFEVDLSVRQPVILFGFPTNGHLSLNNRMYRYTQFTEDRDMRFYNRYYVAYEQPLFQPNRMRNELERARMDLERSELEFQDDFVGMVNDLADDYFELFESAYERQVAQAMVASLERAAAAAQAVAQRDAARSIETDQIRVALANAQEDLQQAVSSFRLQAADIKQRMRLAASDSIIVNPVLEVTPVDVDIDRAVELARTIAPRVKRLELDRRESEMELAETKGNDSFRVDLELSYGREVQDPRFGNLWTRPRNSYTINVDAYVPIWDWGERKHRIRAEEFSMERTLLSAEQANTEIETNVRSQVRSLEEYEQRALNMQNNLRFARDITNSTLDRYASGAVPLVDLLQTIEREADTAQNFVDAYLGYRNALLNLERLTFYDFQRGMTLVDRYRMEELSGR